MAIFLNRVLEINVLSAPLSISLGIAGRILNLTRVAFYTWSQTFSDDDNERSATGFGHNDPFALGSDHGPANHDIRHQFTSNAVLGLPFGITWSGIARITSGPPIDPRAGRDLETGELAGPQPRFMRLRTESGDYDRSNRQVPGVSPLQLQFGARLFLGPATPPIPPPFPTRSRPCAAASACGGWS